MTTHEALPSIADLRRVIELDLSSNPSLAPGADVELKIPKPEHAVPMSKLYKEAYARGDFFAGRYSDPDSQIFDSNWLKRDFDDPNNFWFVFIGGKGELLGSSGFFYDHDSHTAPLRTSDETQIALDGRGKRIMDYFFKRVVPILESAGRDLETDFVLTPESKGLRRSLQTDLGMIALGIHPHILQHTELSITRSEISSAKYHNLSPKTVNILPEFEPLYRIIKSQVPSLPDPDVALVQVKSEVSSYSDRYAETEQPIDAKDIQSQADALKSGYLPVSFDPDRNSFRMARFPRERPDLSFILDNELIDANKLLVTYLNEVLYKSNNTGDKP